MDSERSTTPAAEQPPGDPQYGDLLLVDVLRPDFRHFFSRYRTDLIGFAVVSVIIALIIVGTRWLAMIGIDVAVGQ